MLNMRLYIDIYALLRGVYTLTFFPLTARSLAQYPRNLTDLSSWQYKNNERFFLYSITITDMTHHILECDVRVILIGGIVG